MPADRPPMRSNPFWLLGVSLDDDAQAVVDKAEALADDDPCTDWTGAAQMLRNPHERVRCEVAWLPGLTPAQADECLRAATIGERAEMDESAALADVNIRVLRLTANRHDWRESAEQLMGIAEAWERVNAAETAEQINAHRSRANMRAKATEQMVRMALDDRQADIDAAFREEMERLQAEKKVATALALCQAATKDGRQRAPEAVRRWMKSYERTWRKYFAQQKTSLKTLAKNACTELNRKKREAAAHVTELFCQSLVNWSEIALPIQLVRQGDGAIDADADGVLEAVRSFSRSLSDEHGEAELAAKVAEARRKAFKELDGLEMAQAQDDMEIGDEADADFTKG